MSEDKKINTKDLPKEFSRTTTQQPEEYIDQASTRKDEADMPHKPADDAGDTGRHRGEQETN